MAEVSLDGVNVIVVPDDDTEALLLGTITPGMLKQLTQSNVLMSNDSLRMYVRETQWAAMKDSFKLMKG